MQHVRRRARVRAGSETIKSKKKKKKKRRNKSGSGTRADESIVTSHIDDDLVAANICIRNTE